MFIQSQIYSGPLRALSLVAGKKTMGNKKGFKVSEYDEGGIIAGKSLKGSLTLEAAVSTVVFLLFFMGILSFILILNLQVNVKHTMTETSISIGRKAYILSELSEPSGSRNRGKTSGTQKIQGNGKNKLDQDSQTLMAVGINPASLKLWLISNKRLRGAVEKSKVVAGTGGIYTFDSSFDEQTGYLDMVVNYDYHVPWLPGDFSHIRFVQRLNSHVWTGKSLSGDGVSGTASNTDTVYVTPNGTVYHSDKSCNYLDLSIHSSNTGSVQSQRNANGARYQRCSCCPKGYQGAVYITDYGTNYHGSLSCSGLKRTVIETSIDEVNGMRACSKCGVNH